MALDPDKYFIIIPNMLGNGLSSSPSNTPGPTTAALPQCHRLRQCAPQHRLVTEKFGIEHARAGHRLVDGRAADLPLGRDYPDMVDALAPFCGSAKCSRHNFVFLEGVKAALTADAAFTDGWFNEQAARGLRAMARVYAGWGFSQAFYRAALDIKTHGFFVAGGLPGRRSGKASSCRRTPTTC